ncbi:hypothetical protein HDU76_008420 [Blyttiomyces sp. JEL0837]|nr:hypothetical protein HDU76_008420 [Blyttiomyces sp. JEL0837]
MSGQTELGPLALTGKGAIVASSFVDSNPGAQVVDNESTSGRTRWLSIGIDAKKGSNGDYSCEPQWLNFFFPEDVNVEKATVLYGQLSLIFQSSGNRGITVKAGKVATPGKTTDDQVTWKELVANHDFDMDVHVNDTTTSRFDTLSFKNNAIHGYNTLKFQWNIDPTTFDHVCQMDVEDLHILGAALPPTTGATSMTQTDSPTPTQTNADTNTPPPANNNNNTSSGLSSGAVAAIIIVPLIIIAPVLALFYIRRKNIEKKKKAALALRTQRVVNENLGAV